MTYGSYFESHCVKSAEIRSFFWSVFPVFEPEKTTYLDTFRAVDLSHYQNLDITDEFVK